MFSLFWNSIIEDVNPVISGADPPGTGEWYVSWHDEHCLNDGQHQFWNTIYGSAGECCQSRLSYKSLGWWWVISLSCVTCWILPYTITHDCFLSEATSRGNSYLGSGKFYADGWWVRDVLCLLANLNEKAKYLLFDFTHTICTIKGHVRRTVLKVGHLMPIMIVRVLWRTVGWLCMPPSAIAVNRSFGGKSESSGTEKFQKPFTKQTHHTTELIWCFPSLQCQWMFGYPWNRNKPVGAYDPWSILRWH